MSIYAQAVAAERTAKIAREMVAHESEVARLRAIEAAARNLVAQKGRHHTELAYQRLVEVLTPNGLS
jgi:hypothetical protein